MCDDTRTTSVQLAHDHFAQELQPRGAGTSIAVTLERSHISFTRLDDHKIILDEFVGGTVDGVHDAVRGIAINGELSAGQHGGPQTQ